MVAEDVVNRPTARTYFLCNGNARVSIATNPNILGSNPGNQFALATAAKKVAAFCLLFQRTFMQV